MKLARWFSVTFVAVFIGVAQAQDVTRTVRIDGRPVFSVSGNSPEVAKRVRNIETRIGLLLDRPELIQKPNITAQGANAEERVINVSGIKVITVSQNDAELSLENIDVLAQRWALALETELSRSASNRNSVSGRFYAEVKGSIEAAFRRVGEATITVVPRAIAALLVLLFVWSMASVVRTVMRAIFRRFIADLTIENLIKQLSYYSIWFLGLIIVADALGFEAETVVTGLGLTSLALGFALKDVISNFVSGLVILIFRPFQITDEIVVKTVEGAVEKIELRATQIRTYDGRLVSVPNQELLTSIVTNNTASKVRRGRVTIFLGYDADIRGAFKLITEALPKVDRVLTVPKPKVRISDFTTSDIEVEILFWTDSQRAEFVQTAALVRHGLLEALKSAHHKLPDPAARVVTLSTELQSRDLN